MSCFGRRRNVAIAAALLAGTALAGGGVAWSAGPTSATPAASSQGEAPLQASGVVSNAGFADLITKVKPAVVNISTSRMEQPAQMSEEPSAPEASPFGDMLRRHFEHRGGTPERALGSGFIVDPAGYVVTNNHVIDSATKITVTLDDGNSYPAKVVGHDPKTDLAVLKIDAPKALPYVAFGNSDKARIGDWVVAVGNPFGLGGTVTAGIVSAHDRNIDEGPYDDFLQIDAPINPGNSGGPLFNQSGQVIGIDTAIYSPNGGSVGIGFAIPSNIATKIVAQLRDQGSVERGWLGIQMQPMTPVLAKAVGLSNAKGVLVDEVQADSPAAHAKFEQGDVITEFDGKTIDKPRDLALAVADVHPGDQAKVTVWRNGAEQNMTVTIASQPKEQAADATDHPQKGRLGLSLAPLSSDTRNELGLAPDAKGVVVAGVTPGGPADESGVRAGDLILKVGTETVTTPEQAVKTIRAAEDAKKEAIPLLVSRDGTNYYLALQLAQS
jgi:serine protease Do